MAKAKKEVSKKQAVKKPAVKKPKGRSAKQVKRKVPSILKYAAFLGGFLAATAILLLLSFLG